MTRSEAFLRQFRAVDQITSVPVYLPDFMLAQPGYNDGGPDSRYLYMGDAPTVRPTLDRINAFLDVMAFETNADRTNAVAAALTVMLRNHWPGGKPIVLVTATKSHAGKDTVISVRVRHDEADFDLLPSDELGAGTQLRRRGQPDPRNRRGRHRKRPARQAGPLHRLGVHRALRHRP